MIDSPGARLANVAAALLLRRSADAALERAHERLAESLSRLFEEALVARDDGADDPLGLFDAEGRDVVEGVAAVLDGCAAERVLVVLDGAPADRIDLWLAMTAWPEQVANVLVDEEERVVAAIYDRERMVAAARSLLETDAVSLERLHESVEAKRVTAAELGLDPVGAGASTGAEGR